MNLPSFYNIEPTHDILWKEDYAHVRCNVTEGEFDIDEQEIKHCPHCNARIVFICRVVTESELGG